MRTSPFWTLVGLLLVGCGSAKDDPPAPEPPKVVERDPPADAARPIRLADCRVFPEATPGEPPTWTESASGLLVTTGLPKGYLYTTESYGDFTLSLEYRFALQDGEAPPDDPTQANTGFLVFVPDEHKVWPRSLEVQGRFDEMAHVKTNARDVPVTLASFDEAAQQTARKPIGEWNAVKVEVAGGAVTSYLNGQKICVSEPTELRSGHVGFQAEGFPVEFRNVRIEPR